MVNEDYGVLGEHIMAQALFRLAAPAAVPPRPKASRLILIDPPSRRRHGVIVWLSVLAIALGAAAVWWTSFARPAGAGASPRTARAEIGRVEQTLRVTGTISADHRGTLVAPYMIGNRHASGGTSFALILRRLAPSWLTCEKGRRNRGIRPRDHAQPAGRLPRLGPPASVESVGAWSAARHQAAGSGNRSW